MSLVRAPEITYPDSDGEPMSDNTLQYDWMVLITEGLKELFAHEPNVFIACDLLWYPIEGDSRKPTAPDTMVVFGRPKGYRGSYKQWEEDDVPPQVVFEILSPGNRAAEIGRKLEFYDQYGVEEFYEYDPHGIAFRAWRRVGKDLCLLPSGPAEWTSSRLGTRFVLREGGLEILGPDGRPFRPPLETSLELDRVTAERDALTAERDAVAAERDTERRRAEWFAARLRELGLDPDQIT
jgi:Uma2 family endonuclease